MTAFDRTRMRKLVEVTIFVLFILDYNKFGRSSTVHAYQYTKQFQKSERCTACCSVYCSFLFRIGFAQRILHSLNRPQVNLNYTKISFQFYGIS